MTCRKRVEAGLYWDQAWSLVEGCRPVSEGCRHCWAAEQAWMRSRHPNAKIAEANRGVTDCPAPRKNVWNPAFATPPRFTGLVRIREDLLNVPIKRRRPTVYGIWTDFFHQDVPDAFIVKALEVMGRCAQHTFLILTKRAERMETLMNQVHRVASWPLDNVWLIVTAENQEQAAPRILALLRTAALHRGVSIEPALGAMNLNRLETGDGLVDALRGLPAPDLGRQGPRLDWVVAGPETGPFARSYNPDWLTDLKRQCDAAGVPFFDKRKAGYLSRDLPWLKGGADRAAA